jgi:hypothetical protein
MYFTFRTCYGKKTYNNAHKIPAYPPIIPLAVYFIFHTYYGKKIYNSNMKAVGCYRRTTWMATCTTTRMMISVNAKEVGGWGSFLSSHNIHPGFFSSSPATKKKSPVSAGVSKRPSTLHPPPLNSLLYSSFYYLFK